MDKKTFEVVFNDTFGNQTEIIIAEVVEISDPEGLLIFYDNGYVVAAYKSWTKVVTKDFKK